MPSVKILLALILCASLGLVSCATLANRRDLFSPDQPNGPYTKQLQAMRPIQPMYDHRKN